MRDHGGGGGGGVEGWNLHVDDEHLADLTADLTALSDGISDARYHRDHTVSVVTDLRSGGFATGGALDSQTSRFTLRVQDLARDLNDLADGFRGVTVTFLDAEAAVQANTATIKEGLDRLVGFGSSTPPPTPVDFPGTGHHIKGLYP